MPEPWRSLIVDIRQGKHTKEETLDLAADLEARLEKLISTSALPEHPGRDRADQWLVKAYGRTWRRGG